MDVYVAQKPCGCILAAMSTANVEKKHLAKVVQTWIEAGLTVTTADEYTVRSRFAAVCRCNRGLPLLDPATQREFAEASGAEGSPVEVYLPPNLPATADEINEPAGEGVDMADVDELAEEPQAEGIEEAIQMDAETAGEWQPEQATDDEDLAKELAYEAADTEYD